MKAKKLVMVAAVSAALSFSVTAQAKEEEHEEQSINSSDVPAAVQQAVKVEAKQIGVEMDANGKVLSKHNEAKEHKERGENH